MKYPQKCAHSKVGPCVVCALAFLICYDYSRAVGIKGVRVTVQTQAKMSVTDWRELDSLVSRIIGATPYHHISQDEYNRVTSERGYVADY